jgi:signal transduction histidine kinase
MPTPNRLNRWLPPETHRGLLRRGLIVWAVALGIAVMNWFNKPSFGSVSEALVYSYAISTAIWFFTDPLRIAARGWLRLPAPNYWALNARSTTWFFFSAVLGYALGTWIGDRYAHVSTFSLLTHSPRRFWGFLASSLAISLGFLFFFYQREKAQSLQRQATEARLRLLETQLEPHMLFNTLANLRALITVDQEKAVDMLDRLNGYLRATLRASRSDQTPQRPHTLQDEFERLDDYLALMSVRMGERLRHTLTLPPELARHPLPPLLLQPLVENAIRHGLEPHVNGGEIQVTAQAVGKELVLTVNDTGAGCASEQPGGNDPSSGHSNASGFGLAQVRERLLTAFGPAPPLADRMEWHSVPQQGTRITLHLPLDASALVPA